MNTRSSPPWIALALLPLLLFGCGNKEEIHTEAELGSGDLRWESFPVEIKIDKDLVDETDLDDALAFWENKAGRPLFKVTGPWLASYSPVVGSPDNPDALLENVIFFQNPWPFESTIAGKTLLRSSNDRMESAVIILNGEKTLCGGDCTGLTLTSRRRLLAHELGHFLGFGHSDDYMNIMYPEIQGGGSLHGLKVDTEMLQKLTN